MPLTTWTDARVGELRRLWREGLSATEIALRLPGATRNAVLGKLHRMGLLGGRRVTGRQPTRAPARSQRARNSVRQPPRRRRMPGPEPLEGLVARLEALGPHACRWPIGDPRTPGFRFCGRPAGPRSYCPVHMARAIRPAAQGGPAPARDR